MTARAKKAGRPALKASLDSFLSPLLRALARLRVKPDALTLAGVLVTLPAAWLLAGGHWAPAAAWLLAGAFFDLLDGALARVTGQGSIFGAFWDSTLDRLSEAVVFLGFVLYYGGRGDAAGAGLAFTAGFLSQWIPYARARAEGLGLDNEVGLVTRPVRIIGLAAGLFLGRPMETLLILSFFSLVTVFQRIYHVFKRTESGTARRGRRRPLGRSGGGR